MNARSAEYAEIARDNEGFLRHVEREREHREFTFAELEKLEADRIKLKTWVMQVRAHDYFGGTSAIGVEHLMVKAPMSICNQGIRAPQ